MRCDWKRIEGVSNWECRRCGRTVSMGYAHLHPEMRPEGLGDCPHGDAPSPGVAQMVVRYGTAMARWAAAGMPRRSEEEIERYYRRCIACEHYDVAGHRCRRCGCRVNTDAAGWRNKIAMATERCPIGRWPDEPSAAPPDAADKAAGVAQEAATADKARQPREAASDGEAASGGPGDADDGPSAPSAGAPSALGADAFRADLRAEHDGPTLDAASLYDFFERVYVINLHTRPDRREEFFRRLDRCGWPFRRPTVYPAIHGDTVGVPEEFSSGGGAYGCRMSHLRILQDCLMAGVESVLILEDDADVRAGFAAAAARFLARVPADWQGIMLGGQHHAAPDPTDDAEVVRVRYAQRTHAYAARPEYMRALQRRWGNGTVHIDWRMRDWQHQFRVYAPARWLIGQAGGRSDIAGREKPAEWWNRADPALPVVVLRAPREVFEELLSGGGWHGGRRRDRQTGYDVGLPPCADPTLSAEERSGRLRRWIECVGGEAEEMGAVCVLWHPGIRREQVAAAWGGPVVELSAASADEARTCLPAWIAATAATATGQQAATLPLTASAPLRVVVGDGDPQPFEAFYHVACMGNWCDVVAEQVEVFRRVGLRPLTVAVGATPQDVAHLSAMGLRVIESHANLDAYETPTLQRLWEWAKANPSGVVLYCHTKGVSAPNDARKRAWRHLMMRAVVERWRDNVAMLTRYDAVGVDWINNTEYPHFSGNFWLATAKWIAALAQPIEHRRSKAGLKLYSNPWERMHAEMWLGSTNACRPLSLVCRDTPLVSGRAAFDLLRFDSPHQTLFDAAYDRVRETTDKNSVHCYLPFYASLFKEILLRPVTLVEIGVLEGGSLELWADLFRHGDSRIIGIDRALNGSFKPSTNRIELFLADATRKGRWLGQVMYCDVVIDDGSHELADQIAAFEILWDRVRPGGYYVVEDVQSDADARRLREIIPHAREEDLRKVKNRWDDRIIWTQKPILRG